MRFLNMERFLVSVIAIICGLGVHTAQAIPLQDLFDGASIIVDDKLFTSWQLELDAGSMAVNAADIEVTGLIDDPTTPFLDPGLKFTANNDALTVEGGDFIDYRFSFLAVVLDPRFKIKDASLALTDFVFGVDSDGLISIDDAVFDQDFVFLADLFVEADPIFGNNLFDFTEFAAQTSVFEELSIFVDSGFSGDIAGIQMFELRKSQIPEPATLVLFSVGLGGM